MFTLVIIANCVCSGSSIHEPYLHIPFRVVSAYAEREFHLCHFQLHSGFGDKRFVVKSENSKENCSWQQYAKAQKVGGLKKRLAKRNR